jgi:hypothetical protein
MKRDNLTTLLGVWILGFTLTALALLVEGMG